MLKDNKFNFSNIVAFGDSYSDNGLAHSISSSIVKLSNPPKDAFIQPGTEYWCNRYSNYYVSVEHLAGMLNIPLIDYAISGATTGYKNVGSWMDILGYTGVLGQINMYKNHLKRSFSCPNTLYYIFAGTNDYYRFADLNDPSTIEEATNLAIDNISCAVYELINLGGRYFFIVNCPDLSFLPYEIEQLRQEQAKQFTRILNTKLRILVKKLKLENGINVIDFNLEKLMYHIGNDPYKYSLTTIDKPCKSSLPNDISQKYYPLLATNCLFWDEFHFSGKAHIIIAQSIYNRIIKHLSY